jgi:5-deoxy-glucuronate isomerase
MTLLYKAGVLAEGYNSLITSTNSPLRLVELGRLYLSKHGARHTHESGDRELVLDLLAGGYEVSIEGEGFAPVTHQVGPRRNVFAELPTMLYIPPHSSFTIMATGAGLDIAVYSAPSAIMAEPALVTPNLVKCREVGRDNWHRIVRTGVDEEVAAEKLLVGETLNPSGNWSSYPPHKHDRFSAPYEVPYEEIYLFLVDPPQGFGIIYIHTDPDDPEPLEEVYVVKNGDAVAIPRGYHPVCAAPGYQVCYLWGLSSRSGRRFGAWSNDPRHAWLLDAPRASK